MGWRSCLSGCLRTLPVSYGCLCRIRAEVLSCARHRCVAGSAWRKRSGGVVERSAGLSQASAGSGVRFSLAPRHTRASGDLCSVVDRFPLRQWRGGRRKQHGRRQRHDQPGARRYLKSSGFVLRQTEASSASLGYLAQSARGSRYLQPIANRGHPERKS